MNLKFDVLYESKTVINLLEDVYRNDVILPSIQRRFVWTPKQVEKLFDSILRNYPIGSFLFWDIKGNKEAYEYVFYNLIKDLDNRKNFNEKATIHGRHKILYSILDGQQRLTSLYVGLYGSFIYKTPGMRKSNSNAYPKRELFLNLAVESLDDRFRFLTKEESKKTDLVNLWFPVKRILKFRNSGSQEGSRFLNEIYPDMNESVRRHFQGKKEEMKSTLKEFHREISIDKNVNITKILTTKLDNVLEVFVRVNSAGTVLSKSDLLFSTITASWEEGRDEVEELITRLNNSGSVQFDIDLIMRSCLMMSDLPILFKVSSFKKDNVKLIKAKWDKIADAISSTINLLKEIGVGNNILRSKNSLIPIFYFRYKDGKFNTASRKGIKQYLLRANLNNVFSGHGDSLLLNIRDILIRSKEKKDYSLKNRTFNFSIFAESFEKKYRQGDKSFFISIDDIKEWLEKYKKGNQTYLILNILYGNTIDDFVSLNQDHIHPNSTLIRDSDKYDRKDRLPNLMLLKEFRNKQKQDKPFQEWLFEEYPEKKDRNKFFQNNFIPSDQNLSINAFDAFYKTRKNLIIRKLMKILEIKDANSKSI